MVSLFLSSLKHSCASGVLAQNRPLIALPKPHALKRPRNQRLVLRATAKDQSGEDNGESVGDLLNKAEALMAEIGVRSNESRSERPSNPGGVNPRLALHCDVNGCTIAPIDSASVSKSPPGTLFESIQEEVNNGPRDLALLEGKGWKLGYDRSPPESDIYSAFVGGEDWTITLTPKEYQDFVQCLMNLRRSVATLQVCGEWDKNSEEATLEMSTARVWMQGRAPQRRLSVLQRLWSRKGGDMEELPKVAFSLRFIITSAGSREVEGYWPADCVMSILEELGDEGVSTGMASEALVGA